jgi:hypothetical protein
MAQAGSSSMIFAKAFSASSYSNECSNEMARLNSFFTFLEQDVSNSTTPNCLPGGPQETSSPRLRLIALRVSGEGAPFFPSHDTNVHKKKMETNGDMIGSTFFILLDYNFQEVTTALLIVKYTEIATQLNVRIAWIKNSRKKNQRPLYC